jgi:hypothetical protein
MMGSDASDSTDRLDCLADFKERAAVNSKLYYYVVGSYYLINITKKQPPVIRTNEKVVVSRWDARGKISR